MKKLLILFLINIALFLLISCSNYNLPTKSNQGPPLTEHKPSEAENDNMITADSILIAYFSRAGSCIITEKADVITSASLRIKDSDIIGNTDVIAFMIQEAVGGDLFQIVRAEPYPENHFHTSDLALQEQRKDARPEIATHVENMDDYDIVFLGYPNWWATIPMPVFTFLEQYDFSHKTIIPFCTHEGSHLGRSVQDITSICPQATILDGIAIRAFDVENAKDDVENWLRKLKMIK